MLYVVMFAYDTDIPSASPYLVEAGSREDAKTAAELEYPTLEIISITEFAPGTGDDKKQPPGQTLIPDVGASRPIADEPACFIEQPAHQSGSQLDKRCWE